MDANPSIKWNYGSEYKTSQYLDFAIHEEFDFCHNILGCYCIFKKAPCAYETRTHAWFSFLCLYHPSLCCHLSYRCVAFSYYRLGFFDLKQVVSNWFLIQPSHISFPWQSSGGTAWAQRSPAEVLSEKRFSMKTSLGNIFFPENSLCCSELFCYLHTLTEFAGPGSLWKSSANIARSRTSSKNVYAEAGFSSGLTAYFKMHFHITFVLLLCSISPSEEAIKMWTPTSCQTVWFGYVFSRIWM